MDTIGPKTACFGEYSFLILMFAEKEGKKYAIFVDVFRVCK